MTPHNNIIWLYPTRNRLMTRFDTPTYDDGRPGAVAWDRLYVPKNRGLGFRNLILWNQVVGKWAWVIAKNQGNPIGEMSTCFIRQE